jgi:hypothetical protein
MSPIHLYVKANRLWNRGSAQESAPGGAFGLSGESGLNCADTVVTTAEKRWRFV